MVDIAIFRNLRLSAAFLASGLGEFLADCRAFRRRETEAREEPDAGEPRDRLGDRVA